LGNDVQVIVVDDSDEGEGFEVAKKYPVTYVKKSKTDRRGQAASRNIGLKYCVGSFVSFIDDDDFLANSHLNDMINKANDSEFIYGNHFEFSKDILKAVEIGPVGYDEMLVYNRLPCGSYAIKRDSIRYDFDEDLRSHEDWDFILKNIYGLKLAQFNLFPIVIDKTNNNSSSYMARTRNYFWIDFMAVYARFPCSKLAEKRAKMLNSLGLNIPVNLLQMEPYINQRNFDSL
jgi:glycosyltransferase involved in cell wall biosynthesis